MMIGCRLALAYISSTMDDLPSVRMTLPIDMKNLQCHQPEVSVLETMSIGGQRTQMLHLNPACIVPVSALVHSGQRHISIY